MQNNTIELKSLKVESKGFEIPKCNVMILDDINTVNLDELEDNWYQFDRTLVREQTKKNWFTRALLKYFFGIEYHKGKKVSK